jgi:hypothetical protein
MEAGMSTVSAAPHGTRGFDCNFPVSSIQARSALKKGFRFVARYVPRVTHASNDLTGTEVERILNIGLAVVVVQHVEHEDWIPTAAKGKSYGAMAAHSAALCGVALGTNVFLDLEGVKLHTDPEVIIQYCNYWHDQVKIAGYLPGIYIGWHAILTPDQQFHRLKFSRYWSAYNLDADQFPAIAGACMKQGAARAIDYPTRWNMAEFPIDTDLVTGDAFGRLPVMMAPDEWDVQR